MQEVVMALGNGIDGDSLLSFSLSLPYASPQRLRLFRFPRFRFFWFLDLRTCEILRCRNVPNSRSLPWP
ncbi:uncharacterized protein PHALS_11303 [Plasmopara halstedii]|uniref:Uncharacterized protein n=1 Tax=Plasmopara halstedii TaxID=4781 RepID=A0A0P1AJV6_PLAHL|nr:uncharacterized protein PHALS_11303 [Plasmopara halstedii]CEG41138.1 hypothetical protein PHALS_11303 [Plasmopara halstedii]|eukprot:XP_024577507.1 hypothetical protein PHALS_11303 [Plasmopara halstedii]